MGKLSSIIIIAMLLHTTLLVPNLYSDINDGLVAYYPFNGNANDESGNGNHGTVYGAVPTQDFNGNMNSAYSFDGTNDYIQVSDSNSLDLTTSLTFSAWIKIDSYAGDYPYLLSKEPYNYEPYRFYFQSNQTIFGWASSATIRRVAGVSRGVPIAEWTHVAIIFNSGNIKFYHNGESISSINSTITSLYKTNGSLYIGTRTPANNALDGILDEILIYNRALSATEIQKLADNDSCEVY